MYIAHYKDISFCGNARDEALLRAKLYFIEKEWFSGDMGDIVWVEKIEYIDPNKKTKKTFWQNVKDKFCKF